jgi:hypothetical protein
MGPEPRKGRLTWIAPVSSSSPPPPFFAPPPQPQPERVLESSHSETTYKTAVVQTTWQKEAMAILKRVVATRKYGMQYAEPFLAPVDPVAYVRATVVGVLVGDGSGSVCVGGGVKERRSTIMERPRPVVLAVMCREGIPDYFLIVKHPMDLGTVQDKLKRSLYGTAEEFAADMRLVFSNCRLYNKVRYPVCV